MNRQHMHVQSFKINLVQLKDKGDVEMRLVSGHLRRMESVVQPPRRYGG